MEIINNIAILLKLRDPEQVTTNIPQSRKLEDNNVLVKWGVNETHKLEK